MICYNNDAMRITLLLVGATDKNYLNEGITDYQKRLVHYLPFEIRVIADIKNSRNLTSDQQKEREGKAILDLVSSGDELVLLDVEGNEFSSPGLAGTLRPARCPVPATCHRDNSRPKNPRRRPRQWRHPPWFQAFDIRRRQERR